MEALLTAVVVWLSANYNLPSSFEHPHIEFASAKDILRIFARASLGGSRREWC